MPALSGAGAPALLLVPTAFELRELEALGGFPDGLGLVGICGFGPVAAAAISAERIARVRPARVLLIGIAGTYDPARHAVGTAARCESVVLDGLETAGFEQAPGVGERIDLPRSTDSTRSGAVARLLVTVCAPSRSAAQAAARRERFPDAALEDMEGFGVAVACALAAVPLAVVRGVSNVAGDASRERWRVRDALAAARADAILILEGSVRDGAR